MILYHQESQWLSHDTELKRAVKDELPGFSGGAVVENLPADVGDAGSSPGLGGSHMPRSD